PLHVRGRSLMQLRLVIVAVAFGAWLFPAAAADLTSDEVKSAEKLYQTKCAKCHKFYNPADYSGADWQNWMQRMGKKSKLKPAQYDLLSRYLDTFRTPGKR